VRLRGGVNTQQVLGHLARPLERSLARQHLAPALWLSHDPVVDRLFHRRDRVLSAAVDDAARVAQHDGVGRERFEDEGLRADLAARG
jgi:hypothetical protein